MFAVVVDAGGVEDTVGGLAFLEAVFRELASGGDEGLFAGLEFVEHGGGWRFAAGLGEAGVDGVGVAVVDAFGGGAFASGHTLERAGHLAVPAGDVGEDVADSPVAVPDGGHLVVAEAVDGLKEAVELGVEGLEDVVAGHGAPLLDAPW